MSWFIFKFFKIKFFEIFEFWKTRIKLKIIIEMETYFKHDREWESKKIWNIEDVFHCKRDDNISKRLENWSDGLKWWSQPLYIQVLIVIFLFLLPPENMAHKWKQNLLFAKVNPVSHSKLIEVAADHLVHRRWWWWDPIIPVNSSSNHITKFSLAHQIWFTANYL